MAGWRAAVAQVFSPASPARRQPLEPFHDVVAARWPQWRTARRRRHVSSPAPRPTPGKMRLRRVPAAAVAAGAGRTLGADQGQRSGGPLRRWRITAATDGGRLRCIFQNCPAQSPPGQQRAGSRRGTDVPPPPRPPRARPAASPCRDRGAMGTARSDSSKNGPEARHAQDHFASVAEPFAACARSVDIAPDPGGRQPHRHAAAR
jgi:hypothetical protein